MLISEPTATSQLPIANDAGSIDTTASNTSMDASIVIIASVLAVFFVACVAGLIYMFLIRPRMQNQKVDNNMENWNNEGQHELSDVYEQQRPK